MTQVTIDFIKAVFGHTNQPVHFCSLGNERDGKHPFRKLDTRNPDDVTKFIARWDMAERGLFYCVSTLMPGSKARNKENTSELPMLFADIDLKDVDDTVEEIERKLKTLRFPPSIIVRSGNGIHAIWLLTESVVNLVETGDIDRIENDLRQLADLVGGDWQVCEIARILRLPGTHNTKRGEFKEVVISHPADIADPAQVMRYELEDLEEWFGEQSPIILRKERPNVGTVAQAVEADPYAEYGALAHKPPVDVQARLDAMMFMGTGDSAIHATQLAVSGSMLNSGSTVEEVVEVLLAATKAAAGDYGRRWRWNVEERNIRKMCETWLAKYTPKGSKPAAPSQQSERNSGATVETDKDPASKPSGDKDSASNVVSLAAARKPKPKLDVPDDAANHIKLGAAVIAVIRDRGDDLIFTEKAAWRCSGGIWTMATDGMSAWLNVEIETGAKQLGYPSNNKLISETRQWIQRQKVFWRDDVPWDQHGKVPTRSGLIDPRTLEVEEIKPEHYATWRIETDYDPTATCPWWLQMLEDCFEDRLPEERTALIGVIQEVLGAGLIDEKPRALSRALIFQGGSNFGKSGLLEVLGGLFGRDQNATPIEALEGAHGMMPFVRRAPWVLHEAFDQRKWHFSSAVKAIVTGEPINVNIKNGPMLSLRIRAPIFWGTNHPPQFKEATKAIVNRLIVIECRREFIESEPIGAAIEAFKKGMDKPSSLVLADEKPGLLKWALDGLKRALERGYLSLTKEMVDAAVEIRRDSNLVAGFLEECVGYDDDKRISIPDFCLAFAAWWKQNKGEDRNAPSNEAVGKALISMADPMIGINSKELRDMHRRYYVGIVLNEEGLAFHAAGHEQNDLQGKTANTTDPKGQVNSAIPYDWQKKGAVHAMRVRQRRGMNHGPSATVMEDSTVMPNDSSQLSCDSSPSPQLSVEESLVAQGLTRF